jgi:hypothetical protein
MNTITKNNRRRAARNSGQAKENRRMGRLLSEHRFDKASGEATAPRPKPSEMTIVSTKTGVILPLFRVGQGIPDDFPQVVKDILKAMSR